MGEAGSKGELVHPLDRLTSGGWWSGLARLAVGLGIVGVVLWLSGEKAWRPLLELRMLPFFVGGAALHLAQRTARMLKWHSMMQGMSLLQRQFWSLLRIQLIGLMINLVLPVSEGIKAWSVSRNARDVLLASKSLVADMALHTAMIGSAGMLGLMLVDHPPWLAWVASAIFGLGAIGVLLAMHLATKEAGARVRVLVPSVLGWCVLETALQLAVYGLGARALGLALPLPLLLAVAPMLYVTDLIMITPQGVGAREAVFAATLAMIPGATGELGVTFGLTISGMLLVASILGGAVGLLVPERPDDEHPSAASSAT
jgi:uncharacterized protein (DUF3820 family)